MPIQNNYETGGRALANYDYSDLASGVGYQTFYGLAVNEGLSGALSYILSENVRPTTQIGDSETASVVTIHTSGAFINAESDPADSFDIDFDLSAFNLSRTLKGTAIAQIPWGQNYTPSGALSGAIICSIRKWDGATETDIASAAVQKRINTSGTQYILSTLEIPITEAWTFSDGEVLRVTVEGRVLASSGNAQIGMAHDPIDRAGSSNYTNTQISTRVFKIDIPFEVYQ